MRSGRTALRLSVKELDITIPTGLVYDVLTSGHFLCFSPSG